MQYETLYINDDGTAKVRMTVNGSVLEQDFSCDNLDENVKLGMAIFKEELKRNAPTPVDTSIVGQVTKVLVADLPIISPEDFEPEQPVDTPVEE